jgi:hypothetical protein
VVTAEITATSAPAAGVPSCPESINPDVSSPLPHAPADQGPDRLDPAGTETELVCDAGERFEEIITGREEHESGPAVVG